MDEKICVYFSLPLAQDACRYLDQRQHLTILDNFVGKVLSDVNVLAPATLCTQFYPYQQG
jgi:hypothetical protein